MYDIIRWPTSQVRCFTALAPIVSRLYLMNRFCYEVGGFLNWIHLSAISIDGASLHPVSIDGSLFSQCGIMLQMIRGLSSSRGFCLSQYVCTIYLADAR